MEERKQKTKESYPREDRLEAEVIEGSYGFRPNRSAQGALKQAQKVLDEGCVSIPRVCSN